MPIRLLLEHDHAFTLINVHVFNSRLGSSPFRHPPIPVSMSLTALASLGLWHKALPSWNSMGDLAPAHVSFAQQSAEIGIVPDFDTTKNRPISNTIIKGSLGVPSAKLPRRRQEVST
jgi:hypothetical protein